MKIAVFGLGSIGLRHARILRERFGAELIAFRTRRTEGNPLGIPEVYDWEDLRRWQPQAAFICSPTDTHVSTAIQCAREGMHLFIEKPLAQSLDGVEELSGICAERRLQTYVAYCLRFHPLVLKLEEFLRGKTVYHARVVCSSFLHEWRPQLKEKNYSYYASAGGGAILDLSHEFDYVGFIFGPIASIRGRHGRRSDITVDAEDYADALVETETGLPVNVHLNFLSRNRQRTVAVDFQGGFVEIDLVHNTWRASGEGYEEEQTLAVERDDFMAAQTAYFLEHLGGGEMMNSIGEAKALLEKVLEFRQDGY